MMLRPILSGLVLSLLPVLALPTAASLFTWTSETPVPYSPVSLAGGDLDGDGDLDLVVCSPVTVLLNDGFGRFEPAPGSPITDISFPRSAAIGSFNPQQDQFADLVVISGIYEIKTGWLLLGDGTGRFRLQEFFSVGNSDQAAVADFNGDGYDDVVFSSGQVRFGNGSDLIRGTDLPVALPSVLAGDFDGDGHPDVASTHHIFLSVPDTETFVEAPGSPLEFGTNTSTLAAADFDGDGDLDLGVADMLVVGGAHPVSGVHILLNQGGGLMVHAAFEAVRTEYSSGVATADFDGDGHADLALGSIAEGDEISLLLGDGGGAFAQIDESLRVAGAGPSSLVAANLDSDGKPDLATIDPWSLAVVVFLHAPPPPPVILEVSIDVLPGSDDNVIRLGSQGILPVAILSTDHFDATTVDPASVRLAGAPARFDAQGDPDCKFEDVDRDHLADLLCKVDRTALQLNAGDTAAVLTATTFGGTALRGQDTVRVVARMAPQLPSTTFWSPVGVTPLP